MNIFNQLEKEHNKENSFKIIHYIGNDAGRFKELMSCFFAETQDYRVPQRAAHTVSLIFVKKPELVIPYKEKLIRSILDPGLSSPLKRNILRILQSMELEEDSMGNVYERCFEILMSPKEDIAVRAFSMTVLYNISEQFIELKPELISAIEIVLTESVSSPGIQSRGKNVLKKLYLQKQ